MSDRKPWRLRDRALGPYMERRRPTPHAADRLLSFMAAPIIARFTAGSLGLARRIARVESFSDDVAALSDDGLRDAAQALRPRFSAEGLSPTLVAQCFAMIREASHRHLGKRHYPVQLMGAWALLDGMLAELATGEGKTIPPPLAVPTPPLPPLPLHLITLHL